MLSLAACGKPAANESNSDAPPFTIVGRTEALDPHDPSHLRFSWPGVALGVTFSGTDLTASMRDYPNTFNGTPTNNYYDVVVDGGAPTQVSLTTTQQDIPLATHLTAGTHTVWLTRRTEPTVGSSELFGFHTNSGGKLLPPPAAHNHRIETIGASVETGYGVEGHNCQGFTPAQQNQDLAWPQLTANMLHADLMNTSYSGKGLLTNIDPTSDPVNLMPLMATLTDPRDFQTKWDFSRFTADVVLIDLGGNDWTGLGHAPDPTTFDAAFVDFVRTLLGHYPQAHVYITLNSTTYVPMRDALRTDYQNIVATLNHAGFSRVHYLEFPEYDSHDFGCDGHPTAALHQSMANQMAAQIHTDLGW